MVLLSVLLTWVATEVAGARPVSLEFEQPGWEAAPSLVLQREVRGLVVQHFAAGKLYATRSDQVFVSGNGGQTWSKLGQLAPRDYRRVERWGSRLRGSRVGRAFWSGPAPKAMLALPDGSLLAHHPPWIQRSVDGGRNWRRTGQIPGPAGSVPLHGLAGEPSGRLWALTGASDPHLLRSDDGGRRWEGVSLEPALGPVEAVVPGLVTSLQVDPMRGRVWLTTAGEGEQTQIGWLEGDGTFRAIAVGKAEFQAGSLMFGGEFVSWASDSEEPPHGVWRWARDTEQIMQVAELPGPARYGVTLANGRPVVATRTGRENSTSVELWGEDGEANWSSLLRIRLQAASDTGGATLVFPTAANWSSDALESKRPRLTLSTQDWGAGLPFVVQGELD